MTSAGAEERLDDLPNGKIRMAKIYGAGAAMGFSPQEVNAMSVWQFSAALDGYIKANSAEENDQTKLTDGQAEEIWVWLQELD
ncbi:hypothetical protein [Martelella mangrovi]|uniref:Cytochrome C n=1 Tax=Martelella mangrovi TaxID=1397477 RepID=A0ABV2IIG9_9HYPH